MTRYHHGPVLMIETTEQTAIFNTDRPAHGHSRVTGAVVLVALIAASGGLLFGYDLGVTGGIVANQDFLDEYFPHVAQRDHRSSTGSPFCQYADPTIQLFTSSLFLAGAASAVCAVWVTNKYGRKITMMIGGALFIIGTALVAGSVSLAMLILGRLTLGLGVGFANQATPLYLSEMAPPNWRGALNILFQLATTIGLLGAQLINYATQNISGHGWRISLALGGAPGLLLLTGSLFLPDTPHSLAYRGQEAKARLVLERIRGTHQVAAELQEILQHVRAQQSLDEPYRSILVRKYRPQLVISVLLPMFQQLTGINAIMFYAPQLFEAAGQSGSDSLLSTVTIGIVNVCSTFVALGLVDRLGRKCLFIQGGLQMMLCEIVTGVLLGLHFSQPENQGLDKAVVAFICLFVAGFAWSWGPLAWLVPSEIHPMETRAAGTAIATVVNFIFTFIIGQAFLSMLCVMKNGVFFFFAVCMVTMTLFVMAFLPETKGIPAEQVPLRIAHHWFWRRFDGHHVDCTEDDGIEM
jgi:MFS transporter, SP family, sugar:H+ symporter